MRTLLSFITLASFIITSLIGPMPQAEAGDFHLPAPGVMVHLSPPLDPPMLKGIKVHPDNPFRFDFIMDTGDDVSLRGAQATKQSLKEQSTKLIKYFLASLTIPEKDLWVNLSPYEKDRIIPQSFGLTEMGRDLLAEDYMLKQITASLIYPEDEIGKKFWKRIYEEAAKKFGTTNIPVNTFNKVWIVPEKAVVYENAKAGTAYVVEAKLKVMLEQDYLALSKSASLRGAEGDAAISVRTTDNDVNALGSQIVREIVIPELTKEVNEDKNFSHLRQVYNSLILATWYKKKIKDSILEQVYANKNKVAGVNIDPRDKENIYRQYLKAFKKGVFNYIKEDINPVTQETIPRKYFSGGLVMITPITSASPAMAAEAIQEEESTGHDMEVGANIEIPGGAILGVNQGEQPKDQAMIRAQINEQQKFNTEQVRLKIAEFRNQINSNIDISRKMELLVPHILVDGELFGLKGEWVNIEKKLTDQGVSYMRNYKAQLAWAMAWEARLALFEIIHDESIGEGERSRRSGLLMQIANQMKDKYGIEYNDYEFSAEAIINANWDEAVRRMSLDELKLISETMQMVGQANRDNIGRVGEYPLNLDERLTYAKGKQGFAEQNGPMIIFRIPSILKGTGQYGPGFPYTGVELLDEAYVNASRRLHLVQDKTGSLEEQSAIFNIFVLDAFKYLKAEDSKEFNTRRVDLASHWAISRDASERIGQLLDIIMKKQRIAESAMRVGDEAMNAGEKGIDANQQLFLEYAKSRERSERKERMINAARANQAVLDVRLRQRVQENFSRVQEFVRDSDFWGNLTNYTSGRLKDVEIIVADDVPTYASVYYNEDHPIVIINAELVRRLTDAQLAFVLGHELGHLLLEHVNDVIDNETSVALSHELSYEIEKRADVVGVVAAIHLMGSKQAGTIAAAFDVMNGISDQIARSRKKWGMNFYDGRFDPHMPDEQRKVYLDMLKSLFEHAIESTNKIRFLNDTFNAPWPENMDEIIRQALLAPRPSEGLMMIKTYLESSLRINSSVLDGMRDQLSADQTFDRIKGALGSIVTTIDTRNYVLLLLPRIFNKSHVTHALQISIPRINDYLKHRQILLIDNDILTQFIEAMNKAPNPLAYNRRDDYVYNLLLLAVKKFKREQWDAWLELAREGRNQEDFEKRLQEAERFKQENDKYAVNPEKLRGRLKGSRIISLGDGYSLELNQNRRIVGRIFLPRVTVRSGQKDWAMFSIYTNDDAFRLGNFSLKPSSINGILPALELNRRDFLKMSAILSASFALPGFAQDAKSAGGQAANLNTARKMVLDHLESIHQSGTMRTDIPSSRYWLNEVFKGDEKMYLFALDDIEVALEAGLKPYNEGQGLSAEKFAELAIQALKEQTVETKLKKFFAGSWTRYIISLGNNDKDSHLWADIIHQRAQDIDPSLGEMTGQLVNNTNRWDNKNIETEWQKFNDTFLIPRNYYANISPAVNNKTQHRFYSALIYHIESKTPMTLPDGKKIDALTVKRADRVNFGGNLGHTQKGFQRIIIDSDAIDREINLYMRMTTEDILPRTVISPNKLSGIQNWLDQIKAQGSDNLKAIMLDSTRKHERAHKIYESFQNVQLKEGFGLSQSFVDSLRKADPDEADRIQSEIYAYLSQIRDSKLSSIVIFKLFGFLMSRQPTAEFFAAHFILNQMTAKKLDPKNPDVVVEQVDQLLHLSDVELSKRAAGILKEFFPPVNDHAMINDQKTGGIDLTPANMHLQTKVMDSRLRGNDIGNEGIKFHLTPAQLAQLQNASGFVPVIISIQPMVNLKKFLMVA